jgi:hypothetical protein
MSKKPADPKTPKGAPTPTVEPPSETPAAPASPPPKGKPGPRRNPARRINQQERVPSSARVRWGRVVSQYTDPKTGEVKTRRTFCTPEFIEAAERLVATGQAKTHTQIALALGLSDKGLRDYFRRVDSGKGASPPEIEFVTRMRAADVPRPTDAMIEKVEQMTSALCFYPRSLAPHLKATSAEISLWLARGAADDGLYEDGAPASRMVRFYRAYERGRQNPLLSARTTLAMAARGAVREEIATDAKGQIVYDASGNPVKLLKEELGDIRAAKLLLDRYGDEGERPTSQHQVDVTVSGGDRPIEIDLRGLSKAALIMLAGFDPKELGLDSAEMDLDDEGQDDPLDDEENG